eukprot:scaffold522527_cov51-Prasinocladus_malaysianus.AAC.1
MRCVTGLQQAPLARVKRSNNCRHNMASNSPAACFESAISLRSRQKATGALRIPVARSIEEKS